MAYIGRPLQGANLAVQSGTGDGSDTTPIATLNYATTTNGIAVYLDGVRQLAGTDYNVTAQTTLTFTTAPANGVGVDVYFLGLEVSIPTPADSSISTAKIANNAVDETKLKDALIGDFTDVTVTASDTFLYGDATDSGNTKRDTVQGILDLAGGGAWAVKASGTFSGASLLNITGLTKTTRILMTDVISSGAGLTLRIRTSTDGGSSYDSGGTDYEFIYSYAADNAVTPTGYTTSSDAIKGVSHSIPYNAGEPGLIDITIYDPSATTQTVLKVDTLSRESGTLYYSVGWGVRTSTADVDAVSIFMSGGTFTGNYVALELN